MSPGLRDLGYTQIVGLAAATGLTVPAGAQAALIRCESQNVRWRMDGTNPTATIGYPLLVGEELELDSAQMAAIKFIQQAATANLNVYFFGSPVGV